MEKELNNEKIEKLRKLLIKGIHARMICFCVAENNRENFIQYCTDSMEDFMDLSMKDQKYYVTYAMKEICLNKYFALIEKHLTD